MTLPARFDMPGVGTAGNPVEFALPLSDIFGEQQNLLESMAIEPVWRDAGQSGRSLIPERNTPFRIHGTNSRASHIQCSFRQISSSPSDRNTGYYILFPDTESSKNAIEDIVGGCGARDGIDRV